jgi:isoquinoline 1-oxidoreductase beta subunit
MLNKKEKKFIVGLTAAEDPNGQEIALNAWLEIGEGNHFTFFIPRAEMGQGIYTALTTLICEELDVNPSGRNVKVTHPDALRGEYTNFGMLEDANIKVEKEGIVSWMVKKVFNKFPLIVTGGSSSVIDAWNRLRLTGAQTRWQLLEAAATSWQVPVKECTTENGFVRHDPSGREAGYFEFAEAACQIAPPKHVELKAKDDFKFIGKDIPRLDIPSKVDGSAVFGIDVEMEGMAYAAVLHAPVLGDTIKAVDAGEAESLPGVIKVVSYANWVAVVADSFWTAKNALKTLKITYHKNSQQPLSSMSIRQKQTQALEKEGKRQITLKGDVKAGLQKASQVIKATFYTPYLAHAPLEPLSATALYDKGTMKLWQSTQSSTVLALAANRAAKATGVKLKETIPHVSMIGGGFGIKGELDVPFQASYLAIQCPGIPVKLIWPREEDIRQDKYRPGVISRFEVGLDKAGYPLFWKNEIAGQSILDSLTKRSFGLPIKTGRIAKYKFTTEGAEKLYYSIPNQKIEADVFEAPIQLGFWRSVGHSNNAFFVESMIDFCAASANVDSLAYRKKLLAGQPRLLHVLTELEALSAWQVSLPESHAKGMAIWHSFQSNVGVVATAMHDPEKQTITISKIDCVVDCGIPIHPDNIKSQMEGSVIFALAAFYFGEIEFKNGKVVQSNYNNYQMARLSHTPEINVKIVDSDHRPGGIGEPGVPPSIAAMANAVSKVTGKRVTELPITKMGFKPGALV